MQRLRGLPGRPAQRRRLLARRGRCLLLRGPLGRVGVPVADGELPGRLLVPGGRQPPRPVRLRRRPNQHGPRGPGHGGRGLRVARRPVRGLLLWELFQLLCRARLRRLRGRAVRDGAVMRGERFCHATCLEATATTGIEEIVRRGQRRKHLPGDRERPGPPGAGTRGHVRRPNDADQGES